MKTPHLPPILRFEDDSEVKTPEDLAKRREELWKLACDTFIGTQPTSAPQFLGSQVIHENRHPDGSLRRKVRLSFDTRNRMAFDIEVCVPEGKGPFPVLMMVPYDWWSESALLRGYMVCMYPGADGCDSSDILLREYPDCTWSRLHRRAWLGSRALDYMLTLPGTDKKRICMTGHSRNGKQTLIAASFDKRIKAIASSSPGVPGGVPFRYASRQTFLAPPHAVARQLVSRFASSV